MARRNKWELDDDEEQLELDDAELARRKRKRKRKREESEPEISFQQPKPVRVPLAIAFVASLVGSWLAATSTADFIAHLDRQVHAMHCSVMPGASAELGESGCRTVMLSPYSSWFRTDYWGGIPISLLAFAVFAFLAYRSGHLLWRGKPKRSEASFLLTATLLPCAMSVGYGYIAVNEVGALCTVCSGIYGARAATFFGAFVALLMSERPTTYQSDTLPRFAIGFLEGCGFVAAMLLAYLMFIPEPDAKADRGAAGCGVLVQPEDTAGIMLDIDPNPRGMTSIEVLDPLCPACRAFDERLRASQLGKELNQRAVLFPLDSTCNWMVSTSLHPGACAVSEAMLCAPKEAARILDWAFARQEELMEIAKKNEKALHREIKATFPAVGKCLGSPKARNKVVKSLRWAVANALPVMTPQFFVGGRRLCDEDTDLGLEYTLTRMLSGGGR